MVAPKMAAVKSFVEQETTAKTAARPFSAPLNEFRLFELGPHPSPASPVQCGLLESGGILACPRCGGDLKFFLEAIECKWCATVFEADSGIPRLFFPHDILYGPADVTQSVKTFYDANPFPKYEDADGRDSLREKSLASPLARLLDERLAADVSILDAGCGTGHLANFLSMNGNRQALGGDISLNSLRVAKRFKDRCALNNSGFLQMNLFRPPFRANSFDVVIANNVLHHTSDPLRGFHVLTTLLKPDGLFVLSLYNPLGRFGNDLRRLLFRLSKDQLAFLRWRNERQRARFTQRYKQPWETRHSLGEVACDWFAANEFEFLYCSPRIGSRTLCLGDDLHYPRWAGDRKMRLKTELGMFLRGAVNDGLFVMIGRKRAQPKRLAAGAG
jgi:SAM-dependent methyltransferase